MVYNPSYHKNYYKNHKQRAKQLYELKKTEDSNFLEKCNIKSKQKYKLDPNYHKEYYKNHPEKYHCRYNKIYERNKKIKDELLKIVNPFRNKPCKICNKSFPIFCMDFHHINPKTKTDTIIHMINRCLKSNEILEEIKKCEILCANCHFKINTKGIYKGYPQWFIEYRFTLKCERCNINECLEFHHLDKTIKLFGICYGIKKFSKEIIMKEIEKCQVLCRICHRIVEHEYHKSNST